METPITIAGIGPITADKVAAVEAELLKATQVECPLTHRLADGVCIREVRMPAGALVIGHAHRLADVNILLKGKLTLLMKDGSLKELAAPQIFVGERGRKIAYIHEEVTWLNAWPTCVAAPTAKADGEKTVYRDLGTDIAAIEAYYLDKSAGWQADQAQRLAMARLRRSEDRADFQNFLEAWGLDAERVRQISEDPADQMDFPASVVRVQVGDSAIEGKGLMATATFQVGDTIAPARIGRKRTPAGRFTNHAKHPNARMVLAPGHPENGDVHLVALSNIKGCLGGQAGEEITVDYRQARWTNIESQAASAAATPAKAVTENQ